MWCCERVNVHIDWIEPVDGSTKDHNLKHNIGTVNQLLRTPMPYCPLPSILSTKRRICTSISCYPLLQSHCKSDMDFYGCLKTAIYICLPTADLATSQLVKSKSHCKLLLFLCDSSSIYLSQVIPLTICFHA